MKLTTIAQNVENWYRFYKEAVPPMTSPRFPTFASGNAHLISSVLDGDLSRIRSFKFYTLKSETAYIDFESQKIVLPQFYFSDDFFREVYDGRHQNLAIACINGSLIHEVLHLKLTKYNIPIMIKEAESWAQTRALSARIRLPEKVILFTIGILEDIYIESHAGGETHLFWLNSKNEILIGTKDFTQFKEEFILDPLNIEKVFPLLLMYKVKSLRDDPIFSKLPADALYTLEQITKMDGESLVKRMELFYQFMLCFEQAEDIKSLSEMSAAGFGEGDSGEGKTKTDEQGDESEKASGSPYDGEALANSATRVHSELETKAFEEEQEGRPKQPEERAESYNTAKEFERSLESELSKLTTGKMISNDGHYPGIELRTPKKVELDKIIDRRDASRLNLKVFETKYKNFATMLRNVLSKNTTPGIPTVRGPRIVNTRLHRIATDQKIFGPAVEIDKMDKPEVIVLADLSGSTGTYFPGEDSLLLYEAELGAGYGIFLSLRHSAIPCAVFGHTDEFDTPIYFEIASFQMKGRNTIDPAKEFTKAQSVRLAENYDGAILEQMGTEFTARPRKKILIVLSDGVPSGPGYKGSAAIAHTRDMISKLRKSGIVVFCVSIVPHVIHHNDKIYGPQWNIDASQNLDEQLRALVARVI